jgi:hypothetical protein
MEVQGQRVHQKDDDEEVKGVERPAQVTGCHRVPLIRPGKGS